MRGDASNTVSSGGANSNRGASAHIDTYVLDNLPPRSMWPDFNLAGLPENITYPDQLNCAGLLLNDNIARGFGERPAIHFGDLIWSHNDLSARVDRIAKVLVEDFGLVPGNRVLLRGPNTPMLAASWLATVKAGGIAITTMPLLRANELSKIIDKSKAQIVLCDIAVDAELRKAAENAETLRHVSFFTNTGDSDVPGADLDQAFSQKTGAFQAVATAATDPAIAAFTSGTTGQPKCAVHSHRDLMVSTDCFPRDIWQIEPDHVFSGSPPIAFTFGCGAFILIPLRFGASIALVETPTPENLLATIEKSRVTDLYTAPTMYRRMAALCDDFDISSLKHCNSAGEHLPPDTFQRWKDATGLSIIDALGSTEMFHNFMATPPDKLKPGSTGRPLQGFEAKLIDDRGNSVPDGEIGRLAVRGPNGCLYLDNIERQQDYVQDGWNITGDLMSRDAHGYYWYAGRSDDLIVSSGYNISGIEVEHVLLQHEMVAECAVIGAPDRDRGNIVKAFVVPSGKILNQAAFTKELQDFVKASMAPYKYPRAIELLDQLPRTPTGKIQRFKLRDL